MIHLNLIEKEALKQVLRTRPGYKYDQAEYLIDQASYLLPLAISDGRQPTASQEGRVVSASAGTLRRV